MTTDSFDYIVIGAGSAGSVVAGRLSEMGDGTICVLEAGPPDRNPFIHIPATVVYTLDNPKINWIYRSEPSDGTAGRAIVQSRGKTLGGSGSINGHIYSRGHRLDFDMWAAMGNSGWSYAEVLPYFKRNERRIGEGDDRYRGRNGPFIITDIDEPDPLCDAFIEGAISLGIPRSADYNGAVQEGVNYAQRSLYRGRRVSPARAFLYPAAKRGNTDIRTNSQVVRILFEGKKAVGVLYRQGNREKIVRARAEIILCAGAIGSPHILQVSGIGSPDHLGKIGIPVVQALPGVGENLRDHYGARIVSRIRGLQTVNERVRGWRLLKEILRYGLFRRGALALTPTLVYCFWKSDESLDHGDIQVTFTPASYPGGIWSGLDAFPGATIACWQQRPMSVGYVRACSSDPFEYPEIQPNYLAEEEDRQAIVAAMRLGRRILHSHPFAPYLEREQWPGDQAQSDEELLAHARETGNTIYHPVGTCSMGPAAKSNNVVDAKLRVHGVERLRVADASVMPTMPSANTNAASLMIGEKATDMILGRPALPAEDL